MSLQPAICRRTLHDELVTQLRNMIFEGELRPGNRIAEQRLCTRFGVSRTPLREALKVLSAEGLVRLAPNKGASVARVTREEVEAIIPVLGMLHHLAGELACAHIDDAGIARIRAMHDQLVEHYRRNDGESYSKLNRAFHETILEAANNKVLIEIYRLLGTRLKSLLFVTPKAPLKWAEAVQDHERIMEALEARDGPRLARVAREHVRHRAAQMYMALDILEGKADATVN